MPSRLAAVYKRSMGRPDIVVNVRLSAVARGAEPAAVAIGLIIRAAGGRPAGLAAASQSDDPHHPARTPAAQRSTLKMTRGPSAPIRGSA